MLAPTDVIAAKSEPTDVTAEKIEPTDVIVGKTEPTDATVVKIELTVVIVEKTDPTVETVATTAELFNVTGIGIPINIDGMTGAITIYVVPTVTATAIVTHRGAIRVTTVTAADMDIVRGTVDTTRIIEVA